jgi:hypothetical protein
MVDHFEPRAALEFGRSGNLRPVGDCFSTIKGSERYRAHEKGRAIW